MKIKRFVVLPLLLATSMVYAAAPVFGDYAIVGEKNLELARKEANYPDSGEIERAIKTYGCVKFGTERQPPDCKQNKSGYWFCRGVTNAWCEIAPEGIVKGTAKAKIDKGGGIETQKLANSEPDKQPGKSLAERWDDAVKADEIRARSLEERFKELSGGGSVDPVQTGFGKLAQQEARNTSVASGNTDINAFSKALVSADAKRIENERQAAVRRAEEEERQRKRGLARDWCVATKASQKICIETNCGKEVAERVCDEWKAPIRKEETSGPSNSNNAQHLSYSFGDFPSCVRYKPNPEFAKRKFCLTEMTSNLVCLGGNDVVTEIEKCVDNRVK